MTEQDIFLPYAKVALLIKDQMEEVERLLSNEADKTKTAILKRQLSGLRYLANTTFRVTGDFLPVSASTKALDYCNKNNLGSPFDIGWRDLPKFEGKKNRGECKLIHEHKIPVKSLVKNLRNSNDINDVLKVFLSQEIVWILKEEDIELEKSERTNPNEEYINAGIEVIKSPHSIGHLFKK